MRKLMVGNWKLNQNKKECLDFFLEFDGKFTEKTEAWIAPGFLYIPMVQELGLKKNVKVGAQNCSEHLGGAFTGETSATHLKDVGAQFVILGHSERRQYFAETSKGLSAKVKTALGSGLAVIYCVGETLGEREAGKTLPLIEAQLTEGLSSIAGMNETNLIIAYEPVWAIGTGKTATPGEAQEVHAFIRSHLAKTFPGFGPKVRILYGGSVKPDNVNELLSQKDIDGGLVGGASLKAKDFLALCGDK
ncbi:MAG TPA: triose-phosphate isomerase [Bacteriovoracaceae bacterium]|nr:triose-phosphate isomerase [Bacteriovoracaceae bacterium]